MSKGLPYLVLLSLLALLTVILAGCGGGNSGGGGPVTPQGYVGKIAFQRYNSGTGQQNVWSMNADGTGLVNLTKSVGHNLEPAFSPNGQRIVFKSDRKGGWDLFTMASDGTDVKRLTFDGAVKGAPRWSPDGTKIAYERNTGSPDQYDLWTIHPDGTMATNRTKSLSDERHPAWTPDSLTLFFDTTGFGTRDLMSIVLSTSHRVWLTVTGEGNANPALSPDGTKVLFTSTRTGGVAHVFRIASTGNAGTIKQLSFGLGSDLGPVYLLSATRIAFASTRKDTHWQIFSMRADGLDLRRLTNTATTVQDSAPTWNNGG